MPRQTFLPVIDRRPLQPEDIVKIDITVYLDGYHGDTCRTFVVSDLDVDEPGHALVAASEAALAEGIEACGPGKPFRGIGKSIYNTVVKGKGGRNIVFLVQPLLSCFLRSPP